MKSPRRQGSQVKQWPPCQPTPTRWPGFQATTSGPTVSTRPAISWPGIRGYGRPGQSPSLTSTSLWQTPQASTLMRTCARPGSGMGRSTSSNGPPGLLTCTAFMRGMCCLLVASKRECAPRPYDGKAWAEGCRIGSRIRSGRADGRFAEPLGRHDGQHGKQRQDPDLRDHECRLGLRGRHRAQDGHLLEGLHHPHEHVEVEGKSGADGVDATPGTGEAEEVTSENRQGEYHQRYDADLVRGQQMIERKGESRPARGRGGDQEERGPAVELLPAEETEHDDDAGAHTDQAQYDVHERECRGGHPPDHWCASFQSGTDVATRRPVREDTRRNIGYLVGSLSDSGWPNGEKGRGSLARPRLRCSTGPGRGSPGRMHGSLARAAPRERREPPAGRRCEMARGPRSPVAFAGKSDLDPAVVAALVVDLENAQGPGARGRGQMRSATGLPVESHDLDHADCPIVGGRRRH